MTGQLGFDAIAGDGEEPPPRHTSPADAPLTAGEILAGSIEEDRPPLIVRLAEELVWKLEHPQQHASGADHALADFLIAVPGELPDNLRERITGRLPD
ncbi:MAG TPA: hypothetical protein VGK41_05570 [Solirubrobacterales bacterium]